jgi:hypothetical protein
VLIPAAVRAVARHALATGDPQAAPALRPRGEEEPGPALQVPGRPDEVRRLDHTHFPTRHLQGCRFIDSEADLDIAIKGLLPLSQVPSLAYPEMVRSGTAETLVGLLSHENMDIVIDVVELVHELTDEDVGDEGLDDDENEDEDEENKEAPLKTLIEGLVSDPGLGCLSNSDSQTTSKPALF